MRKWTYLVAALLMSGSATTFTSCIDTDEPAGIEILRGAKAELLKAKAAVEAAKVAEVQANAALIQAQAELVKAQAATEQAQAKINESIAEQERIKAEMLATDNEMKKAELAEYLKECERTQAEWEAEQAQAAIKAEQALKEWELSYKTLQANYEKLLVELATAKANLTAKQYEVLQPYIAELKTAQTNYTNKAEELRKAQRDLAEAIANQDVDKDFVKRTLEWEVKMADASVKGHTETLAEAKAMLEEAMAMTPSEYGTKEAELEEKLTTLRKELIALRLQVAENTINLNTEYSAKQKELSNDYLTYMNKETVGEEIKITLGEDVPFEYVNNEILVSEIKYTNADIFNYKSGYYSDYYFYKLQLEHWLNEFISWQRDENDNVWTSETISSLEYDKKNKDAEITVAKQRWQEAIDAFKAGEYMEYDATAISGYNELNTAVTEFNVRTKAYNDISKKIYDAIQAKSNAWNVYNEAYNEAWNVYNEAYQNLDAVVTAEKERLLAVMNAKEEAYNNIVANPEATPEAINQALKEFTDAQEAYSNFNDFEYRNEKDSEYIAKREDTISKAEDARDKILTEQQAIIDAENINLIAAIEKVIEQRDITITAFNSYSQNANEDSEYSIDVNRIFDIESAVEVVYREYQYPTMGSLAIENLTDMDYEALRNILIIRSGILFGYRYTYEQNPYGDPSALFTELTAEQITEMVKAEELSGWNYLNEFSTYGLVGERLNLDKQIEIATAWLTNSEKIKALIAPIQEKYDALLSTEEEVLLSIEEKGEAMSNASNEYTEKVNALSEPLNEKLETYQPLYNLYTAVVEAIQESIENGDGIHTQEDIDALVSSLESQVKNHEKLLYDAETALMRAQSNLENWNSDAIELVEMYQKNVEDLTAELANFEALLQEARTALENAMDKMSVDTEVPAE